MIAFVDVGYREEEAFAACVVLQVPVAGVAKSPFRGSAHAVAVTRGQSGRPLFVTAVGAEPTDIAERLARMHGPYRLPTALRRVDDLSKGRG